ncbi:uncharacterized protein KY384_005638 [Bacidia gigantensis]|uniref:uncharacterized protein n=1 Tax=Bacidia gigantensis TaxID=2732470 RepID=UPI001D03B6ED|nr:uncharacterized protein KY384_005638 [Bacidia gigantensis]KAG8530155.1 hypothetical protein KY384_005638 [Bacidia gigantensis]
MEPLALTSIVQSRLWKSTEKIWPNSIALSAKSALDMTSSPLVSPPPLKRRRVSLPERPCVAISSDISDPGEHGVSSRGSCPPHALRVFSWNVNGIDPFLPDNTPKITTFLSSPPQTEKPTTHQSIRASLLDWSWPHIVCLQEVKIAPTDIKTQAAFKRQVNTSLAVENDGDHDGESPQDHHYDVHFSLPRDKYNATGFGGKVHGVCTLVRQDLPGVKIGTVKWDLEGRVIICEMTTDQLAVINVYAVNGTMYDYRDPESGKVIGTRHDRKRSFHTHLCNEVKAYEAKGWNVVIIGDINISRSSKDSFPQLRLGEAHVRNRADFERKFITELRMVDTFRFLKRDERKYTYRPTNKPWGEGGDRVDMALVTKGLSSRLEDADMLDTEKDRGPSDHVPLYISLSAQSGDTPTWRRTGKDN